LGDDVQVMKSQFLGCGLRTRARARARTRKPQNAYGHGHVYGELTDPSLGLCTVTHVL
jgi:hypothetical protein